MNGAINVDSNYKTLKLESKPKEIGDIRVETGFDLENICFELNAIENKPGWISDGLDGDTGICLNRTLGV